ncbi:Bystin-domain-containing protein [Vararia minispora EC-137]|uniref:Bystin-domain-containing protein n=1 Tax=Vararia minispora EC-137 TaxID=1314806 RepID=A0ACB8QW09_9AGAM|nr:Bystin-domain-containing protein [Vararia minispora EC-137]
MPRTKSSAATAARHDPLHIQLAKDDAHAKYGRLSQPGKRKKVRKSDPDDDENTEAVLDPKASKRIFELAKVQQEELEEADEEDVLEDDDLVRARDLEEIDEDEAEGEYADSIKSVQDIDAGDAEALDALLPPNAGERKTLADLIFAKLESDGAQKSHTVVIQPHETRDGTLDPAAGLDPKVVEVYTKVGQLLRNYRSGPLPKPFKIVPSLPAWARILALTHPEAWSPAACHAATRIFVSNMKPSQAQVFLQGVVLDAIREDISNPNTTKHHRKLNVHYYEALKRSLYKPAAFFKGIVFPLLETGCTLKEAAIVASVLAKVSVPVIHSSGALVRLSRMDYSGATSLFIRVLLDKKYTLPYQVLDALVFHFIRISNTHKGRSEALPVLWHQSLLVFCQRYAEHLTPDQKNALLDVVRVHPHPQIAPDVRRELATPLVRGDPRHDERMDVS